MWVRSHLWEAASGQEESGDRKLLRCRRGGGEVGAGVPGASPILSGWPGEGLWGFNAHWNCMTRVRVFYCVLVIPDKVGTGKHRKAEEMLQVKSLIILSSVIRPSSLASTLPRCHLLSPDIISHLSNGDPIRKQGVWMGSLANSFSRARDS